MDSLSWDDYWGSQGSDLQVHLWRIFYEKEYRWVFLKKKTPVFVSLEWLCNTMALNMRLTLLTVPLGEVKMRPLRNKSNLISEKDNLGFSWTKWSERAWWGLLGLGHQILQVQMKRSWCSLSWMSSPLWHGVGEDRQNGSESLIDVGFILIC